MLINIASRAGPTASPYRSLIKRGTASQSSPAGTVSSIFFKNLILISVTLSPKIIKYYLTNMF